MVSYHAIKVKDREDFIQRIDSLERAYVTHYPWGCTYRPDTYGVLAWDDENIHVYMRSYEKNIRAEARCDNGDIYQDSCMEFFFNPCPGVREVFFNLEVNPLGYVYLAFGPEDAQKRTLLNSDAYNHFGIEIRERPNQVNGEYWHWLGSVPFAFISEHVPDFKKGENMHFTGNFFKCGDKTETAHFGCWSEIIPDSDVPQFYRIQYFGDIYFDKQ